MHTVVDVVANYNSLVCDDLKMFMEDTQFIKVCASCGVLRKCLLDGGCHWVYVLNSQKRPVYMDWPACLSERE